MTERSSVRAQDPSAVGVESYGVVRTQELRRGGAARLCHGDVAMLGELAASMISPSTARRSRLRVGAPRRGAVIRPGGEYLDAGRAGHIRLPYVASRRAITLGVERLGGGTGAPL
jgi:hypothetical protein